MASTTSANKMRRRMKPPYPNGSRCRIARRKETSEEEDGVVIGTRRGVVPRSEQLHAQAHRKDAGWSSEPELQRGSSRYTYTSTCVREDAQKQVYGVFPRECQLQRAGESSNLRQELHQLPRGRQQLHEIQWTRQLYGDQSIRKQQTLQHASVHKYGQASKQVYGLFPRECEIQKA